MGTTPQVTEALDYLFRLQGHGIVPTLARMEALMDRLCHPERTFPSIHIAGTNGKGSTAAMVASVLTRGGYRTGLYTSPHLIDFSERIRINGTPIPAPEMIRLTSIIRDCVKALPFTPPITFFEFTTALAFLYFSEQRLDYAVLEVGMGGRFDATNLVLPLVAAITTIALDHEQYLGETIEAIAKEKAGIIKKGVPVVTAVGQEEVLAIFEGIAHEKGAPLIRLGHEIRVMGDNPEHFVYIGLQGNVHAIHCSLAGPHQVQNAGVALGIIECLQQLGVKLSHEVILKGIAGATCAGRFETVHERPRIILDGAHNPAGVQALVNALHQITPDPRHKRLAIVGIMKDKRIADMLSYLLTWAHEIIVTAPNIPRAASPADILASLKSVTASRVGTPVRQTPHKTVPEAIAYAVHNMQPNDTLTITGSLYTIGEAKAYFAGTTPSPIRG